MKSIALLLSSFLFLNCKNEIPTKETATIHPDENKEITLNPDDFYKKLSNAALSIIDPEIIYTPDYVGIKYPNGDVPHKTGVCTDVIIRAYRKLNIDLQKEVHEDMKANFSRYPKTWGLQTTDKNIDHRRVPNLEVFFTRKGEKLAIFNEAGFLEIAIFRSNPKTVGSASSLLGFSYRDTITINFK